MEPDLGRVIEHCLEQEAAYHEAIKLNRLRAGRALGVLRRRGRLSYRNAAALIGCDTSALHKLEKGKLWSQPLLERAMRTLVAHVNGTPLPPRPVPATAAE